jgi:hypothetical protein
VVNLSFIIGKMADPIAELHVVLQMCGVAELATRNNIITKEGFTSLEDLGMLESDLDVTDMAKRMAAWTIAEGRVQLQTVVVKRFQTLVWWVRNHQKRGLALNAADFTAEVMKQAGEMKSLKREMADKEPSVSDLGKFDPDEFDAYEDAFINLLAQSFGVLREPLRYVVHLRRRRLLWQLRKNNECTSSPLSGIRSNWTTNPSTGSSRLF